MNENEIFGQFLDDLHQDITRSANPEIYEDGEFARTLLKDTRIKMDATQTAQIMEKISRQSRKSSRLKISFTSVAASLAALLFVSMLFSLAQFEPYYANSSAEATQSIENNALALEFLRHNVAQSNDARTTIYVEELPSNLPFEILLPSSSVIVGSHVMNSGNSFWIRIIATYQNYDADYYAHEMSELGWEIAPEYPDSYCHRAFGLSLSVIRDAERIELFLQNEASALCGIFETITRLDLQEETTVISNSEKVNEEWLELFLDSPSSEAHESEIYLGEIPPDLPFSVPFPPNTEIIGSSVWKEFFAYRASIWLSSTAPRDTLAFFAANLTSEAWTLYGENSYCYQGTEGNFSYGTNSLGDVIISIQAGVGHACLMNGPQG